MKYFAYGSNMLRGRLTLRVGAVRHLGVARVHGHRLAFHKRGGDGSGKCDVWRTSDPDDVVYGVVYEIDTAQKTLLDHYEGRGYARRWFDVGFEQQEIPAYAYVAEDGYVAPELRPFDWYKALVLAGALEHGLPLSYVRRIQAAAAAADPDGDRHQRNLEVLRDTGFADIIRLLAEQDPSDQGE